MFCFYDLDLILKVIILYVGYLLNQGMDFSANLRRYIIWTSLRVD